MKKSVYSLVLMDDVIEAIDVLAYTVNTSRSNLINQILAERVALTTPQVRMQAMFDEMSEILANYQHFKIQNQASDSMFSVRSVLKYKYNPTIRYAISLNKSENPWAGELKVISRTQSEVLSRYFYTFFNIWSQLERQHGLQGWIMEDGGKWNRGFVFINEREAPSSETVAQAITSYIRVVDEGLKIYFAYSEDVLVATKKIGEYFKVNLEKRRIII